MRLYIAGPMSNIPQHNMPAFFEAAEHLREEGYDIISPAEIDKPSTRKAALASPDGKLDEKGINGETWGDFLARDIKIVADDVDGIMVLPGWQKSMGARLETYCAYVKGKPIYSYNQYKSRKSLIQVRKEHLVKAWIGQ